MVRGFYNAGSGLVTQEKRLNSIANNLANVTTAGYKKDGLTISTFGEHMAVRMNAYQTESTEEIGRGVWMTTTDENYTSFGQGGFEMTNRPMDMAIAGEGFYVIRDIHGPFASGNRAAEESRFAQTPNREQLISESGLYLTRDGQFSLDAEGFLVHPGFGRVQGTDGDIYIGTSEFQVGPNGEIYLIDAEEDQLTQISRLLIAQPDDYAALQKAPNGMFIPQGYNVGGENDDSFQILQGHVERSNVNMAMEMTEMMAAQRSLQSASQILKMYDTMTEQAYSRISRIQ